MVKKFENIFTRFDTIHERDRQTDRHRTTAYAALMHASHGKHIIYHDLSGRDSDRTVGMSIRRLRMLITYGYLYAFWLLCGRASQANIIVNSCCILDTTEADWQWELFTIAVPLHLPTDTRRLSITTRTVQARSHHGNTIMHLLHGIDTAECV